MSQKKVLEIGKKEKLRKNEVEETHNSGSQKDPKERSKVGKNGGESE